METRRVQEEKEVEKEENEDLLRVSVTHLPDVTFHDMERSWFKEEMILSLSSRQVGLHLMKQKEFDRPRSRRLQQQW